MAAWTEGSRSPETHGGALGRKWQRQASRPLTWPLPTAYKDKMKELSVLSLICSCFYSQPHPNTIYQYGGECARPGPHCPFCGLSTPLAGLASERGPLRGGAGLGAQARGRGS